MKSKLLHLLSFSFYINCVFSFKNPLQLINRYYEEVLKKVSSAENELDVNEQ